MPAAQTPDDIYVATPSKPKSSENKVSVHGSVQADILFPETDYEIDNTVYDDKVLGNIFADVALYSKYIDAGLRFEYLQHPLPGFEPDYKGWGVPNIFVKGKFDKIEVTLGDIYDQFGSGFILRTYEDRALGIDNSIRGARVSTRNINGMRFTVLGGVQRRFWDWSLKSQVYGANAEVYLNQLISKLSDHGWSWMWGASYVAKHEEEEDIYVPGTVYKLHLPKVVGAFDIRTQFMKKGFDVLLEYAWKSQDPSFDNDYTYANGNALMVSASYTRSGMGILLQAKRSDNMAFRSKRSQDLSSAFINNMPPFAYQSTYALAAMYPYATQAAPGEWAFSGNFTYKFKRKTPLGGKYGTTLTVNAAYIRGLDRKNPEQLFHGSLYGTNGGKTSFFGMGETYYRDIDVMIEKRIVRDFQLNFSYVNQVYNKTILEGHGGNVHANIFILDGKWTISKKVTGRMELQYLQSKQDYKDWAYGLIEVSVLPYLMFTVSDMWNCGDTGTHYYMGGITGTYKANRLMLSYGRTRAGFNCSGGVCRWVPATHGFQISYNYNF
ncbi:MAG: hypothetical protein J1D77_05140 [Muribaculaceae bacterium]|nr:hypothetical protein [Muribaculaceae bacterium]